MDEYDSTNRNGLKVHIQVDTPDNPEGLVFIAHGQKGSLGQVHIQAFADAFLANNFRVVRFDATHALGKSDGDVQGVTYDTYISDLEDVIEWAKTQEWYQEPFALCGHSMGAQSTTWYAEHHPEKVNLLASMAPVINYALWSVTIDNNELAEWQRVGYQESMSKSKGISVRVGWQVNESLKKFDLLPLAAKLTMPVAIIVGDLDKPCPPRHQQVLLDAIAGNNTTLRIIKNSEHSYRNAQTDEYAEEVDEMKRTLYEWISINR